MRTRIGAVAALACAAWFVGPLSPAVADTQPDTQPTTQRGPSAACTIIGTPQRDVLRGTSHDDYICGLGGNDKILGMGGDDVLQGGGGDDQLVGGPGNDVLGGGRGDDLLNGVDGTSSKDRLRCGRGDDTAKADVPDVVRGNCETVFQDHVPTDITLTPTTYAENQPVGTTVGSLTATDADAGQLQTFTLVPGAGATDNARFSISGSALKVATVLDFETAPSLSIRVRTTDATGLTFEKSFAITVTDVDDPPVAVDDTKTVVEDDPATAINVLANDTDVDGGPKSVVSVTQPTHGTVAITGGGTGLTYKPDADYCNTPAPPTDDFTYTLNGGDVGAVAVTVTCVDDSPVAVDDTKTVGEDASATAVDVLANDTDVDAGPKSIQSVTQPTHGTVVITGGGTGLTYAPHANYCNDGTPTDDFTYALTPGGSTATVHVTVSCVDDPPVAVDDSGSTTEDAAATPVAVLTNDTDIDGGPKTIQSVTQPAHGTVAIIGGGAGLTYAPDADYCNTPPPFDTFTYMLNGGSNATVSMTVSCVDDAPVAVNDAATVAEDSGVTPVAVLANDTDVDGGPKSIGSVTQPANGAVVITGGGTGLTYKPNANYCNTPPPSDTFTYTLTPGGSTATVAMTVTCVDDAPVAVNDSATVTEDAGATAVAVLVNDTDIDGGPRSVGSVTQPANGTVAITGGGTGLTYAPNANYCNSPPGTTPDTFTYTLSPGGSVATVSVSVTCVDDPPVAVDDTATVVLNAAATAVAVLANDTDVDGGPKSIGSVTQPAHGTVVITGGGTGLTYQPTAGYCNDGSPFDTFTYTLNGGSTATVKMTVTCDIAPTAVNDAATVAEDSAATAVTVLANDTDPDGGPKSIGSVTQAANGTVVITGGGTGLTYKPNADYCNNPGPAPDTFTYSLTPGGSTATVSMTVTCVDDPPVAVNDSATVNEDSGATAVSVLVNDTDIDGGPKSISSVTQPANGTVVITGGGTGLTYAPSANFCGGPDTFTYTLNGGSIATVSMTVTCVADPPVVGAAGTLSYTENDPATAIAPALTVTDPDAGGTITGATVAITANFAGAQDLLALGGVHPGISAGPQVGNTLTLTGTATPAAYASALQGVTYANSSDAPSTLTRTVTFTVTDDSALSGSATRGISVAAANDAPVAVNDSGTTDEDTSLTVAAPGVLANDTDVDPGDSKTVVALNGTGTLTQTLPSGASVTINANGSYTYNPLAAFQGLSTGQTGSDSFTYKMQDTAGAQSTATVTITINGVSDAPTAVADSFDAIGNTGLFVGTTRPATQAGKVITGSVLSNDTDPDTAQASLVAEPVTNAPTTLGGTITILANGSFTYQPDDVDTGVTDTFTYRVCDASPCNAGTVSNATGTLSLPIAGQVWYVRNNEPAGGDGTSDTPFDTLAEAEAASGTGDTTYVFDGSNTTTNLDTGYAMNANERLIGESQPLSLDPDGGGPLGTSPLFPGTSGAQPTLTASNEDVIVLASNVLVDGVDVDPSGVGGGISGGAGVDTVTVQNVHVTDTGTAGTQPGIEMDGTIGVNRFTGVTVTNGGSATAIGVRINNADRVLFANTATNTIATTGAKALDVTSTSLLTSRWNDITVTGSGTGAIRFSSVTGQAVLGDGSGTDLSLQTTSGATAAFDIASSNTLTVDSAGTDTISATGGPAMDIRNSNGSQFFFDSASSTNSAGDGVNLDTNLTAPVVINGGTISGAAGIAFDVNGGGVGGGGVVYDGAINDGPGQSVEVTGRDGGGVTFSGNIADSADAGGGIVVSGNSAGSTSFSGASKVLNTGASTAVALSSNGNPAGGHLVSFTNGGLDIDTTSGAGLTAFNGTLTVGGTGNSITTGTGTALSVNTAGITAGNLNFDSISANGAANGIVLSSTGTFGRLVVAGTGGTCTNAVTSGCTGGQIRNTTGADDSGATPAGTGIVLNNTLNPSLTRMWIHDNSNYAIRGTSVSGFSMDNSVINGTNGNNGATPFDDSSVWFDNLTGSASVTNTYVAGGYEDNVRVHNSSGSLNRITFNSVTIGDNNATNGNDGINLESSGTATFNATVASSTFTAAEGDLLQFDHAGSGTGDLVLTGNAFSNNHPGIATGGGGLTLTAGGSAGATTMSITGGNTFRDAVGNALTIAKSTGPSTLTGTFSGNTIGVNAVANSGSAEGDGLKLQTLGQGTMTWAVTNNTIRGYNNFGVDVLAGGSATAQGGTVNATVTGNTIDQPGNTAGTLTVPKNGVHLNIGTVVGDTYNACAVIGGAGPLANALASGGADAVPAAGGGQDVRLRQRQSTTIRLPGYGGGATDTTAVQNFVAANNSSGGPTVIASVNAPPGGGFTGTGSTCP